LTSLDDPETAEDEEMPEDVEETELVRLKRGMDRKKEV